MDLQDSQYRYNYNNHYHYYNSNIYYILRYLRQLRSKPDFFITFTANANWKEVKETMSMHNVTMNCRDDIIARVFNAKLKLFLHDLFKSNALGMYLYKCQIQLWLFVFREISWKRVGG